MNGFVRPRLKRHERVEFLDKLTGWERFKYKYINTFFLRNLLWRFFRLVLLIGVAYVVLFPFISKLSTSFMSESDFSDVSVNLIPKDWTLDTYDAIIEENDYWEALRNTALLSAACGVVQSFCCALVGYGFAKFKFKGKSILFFAVILTMIIPHDTIQFSMFSQFRYFDVLYLIRGVYMLQGYDATEAMKMLPNLLDSYWPLTILSFTCLAFKNGLFIFVFRQYYKGVPDELEEAAYDDGAGVIKTYLRIIIPMSIPIFVTIFMFAFSWQWTDKFYTTLFFPSVSQATKLILMPDIIKIPASLGTSTSQVQEAWEAAVRNTCGMLILLPLLIIYLFAQRTLIQGIERTGITG